MKKIILIFICFIICFICSCKNKHEHTYIYGLCECGEVDPNYKPPHDHNFVEGTCECGEIDPNYKPLHIHEFIEGTCGCGEVDPNYKPPHIHNFIKGVCECGEIDSTYKPVIIINIIESTLEEEYYIDEFDISTIKITISIDEEVSEFNLTTDLIENYPSEVKAGSYTFIINYEGVEKELTLNFIEKEFYTEGLSFSVNKTLDGYLVSGYNGTDSEVVIPSYYDGYPVTGIMTYAFNGNQIITKVILPDTIEIIEQNAFSNSTICEINIPESVIIIKDAAFYYCDNLRSITLNKTIKNIGDYAFSNTTLVYTDKTDISSWNSNAFDDNLVYIHTGLDLSKIVKKNNFEYYVDETASILNYVGNSSSVIIPNEIDGIIVNKIENSAFMKNTNLEEVTINNNIIYICDRAFRETGLVNVEIPSSVKEIGVYAFSGCEYLENVTFNEGLEKINISAFAACVNLQEVILPSTLTTIEQYAFQNCLRLQKAFIPKSVLTIGDGAFYACSKATLYIEANSIPATWSINFNPSKAKLSLNANKENI